MSNIHCEDLVEVFLSLGLTARYVTHVTYLIAINNLDVFTFLVYTHEGGEDIILIADNLIDLVRFKFHRDGSPIRG